MNENKLQIRYTDNGKVVYIYNGRVAFGGPLPLEQADQIAKESTRCARKAEEIRKASEIVYDNALMQRGGAPIGLSDHPKIKDETIKEALWNRELRRYLPYQKNVEGLGNIKSRGAVGAPSLVKVG